ncbi:MAG: fumarylacetoacetate hydrolase family protein [Candidatus Aminicenantes bacterium]|nr:fumarylacetoacetate hydrolase family protein [Candidatus Aminicenantes bacterium]
MKIYRFLLEGRPVFGVLREDRLHPLRGSVFEDFETEEEGIPIGRIRLLPPCEPSKIVAVGINYRGHAQERSKELPKEPLLFLKPPSALVGPGGIILHPRASSRVDYEGELAVVIRRGARHLSADADVGPYILGLTCFNDVTARDLQDRDVQFTRAKSFDTFAAAGPCIAVGLPSDRLEIKTFHNGKLRQSSNTRNLIFSVPELLRAISWVMTLLPGDLVTTGTPPGVGPMKPGDRVDVQIEGIGTLSNTMAMDEDAEVPRRERENGRRKT